NMPAGQRAVMESPRRTMPWRGAVVSSVRKRATALSQWSVRFFRAGSMINSDAVVEDADGVVTVEVVWAWRGRATKTAAAASNSGRIFIMKKLRKGEGWL